MKLRAAACALAVALSAACAAPQESDPDPSDPIPRTFTTSENDVTVRDEDPARVVIPRLKLDEPLIPLGVSPSGTMDVPQDAGDAGWLTTGGRPGQRGPTVIAGHVDSASGPGVFFELTQLVPGDVITVISESKVSFGYRIVRVAEYAKASFPTEVVFGATFADELRLITCTGDFDASASSYRSNWVVFAQRV